MCVCILDDKELRQRPAGAFSQHTPPQTGEQRALASLSGEASVANEEEWRPQRGRTRRGRGGHAQQQNTPATTGDPPPPSATRLQQQQNQPPGQAPRSGGRPLWEKKILHDPRWFIEKMLRLDPKIVPALNSICRLDYRQYGDPQGGG